MLADLLKTMQDTNPLKQIKQQEYELWRSGYTFDGLQGLRYGQSFCNYFDISDNLLFYSHDPQWCDKYIKQTYIR